jgi:hypothetical protein
MVIGLDGLEASSAAAAAMDTRSLCAIEQAASPSRIRRTDVDSHQPTGANKCVEARPG